MSDHNEILKVIDATKAMYVHDLEKVDVVMRVLYGSGFYDEAQELSEWYDRQYEHQEKKRNKRMSDVDVSKKRQDILDYVGRLRVIVREERRDLWAQLWKDIVSDGCLTEKLMNKGKQKDTTFNRNLVANIVQLLVVRGWLETTNVTRMTELLEGDRNHSVRQMLGTVCESPLAEIVERYAKVIEEK